MPFQAFIRTLLVKMCELKGCEERKRRLMKQVCSNMEYTHETALFFHVLT